MSNTSDQTTQQSKTRLIVGEVGVDTETGIVGKGHSYDNGKTFTVDDTIYGRIYHADDHDKIWKGIQDQVAKVVDPAKSAADSAVNAADTAVASAQVTSATVSAVASATAEAKQGANEAMSRAKSAWDVATGAKEAVTDFDPLLKSAQSDADKALTQIADTANALSDAKTSFGSDVAAAKELASTAQTTADSAVAVASDARSNATVAIQTASGASLTAINAQGDATVAKQTASEAIVQASNAESDFSQLSIRANKIEANVATNSGAIASVQQTANGLTTTVADIKANGGGTNLLTNTSDFSSNWSGQSSVSTTTEYNGHPSMVFPPSNQLQLALQQVGLENSSSYAISFWAKADNAGDKAHTELWGGIGQTNFVLTTNWVRYTASVTSYSDASTNSSHNFCYFGVPAGNTGNVYIALPMLEEGTVSHTWSPAPDDLQDQFTQIKQSVNGVTTTINDPKTGLNATYQTAAGNSTTISSVKGDVTQLQSTANGLTSRVGNLESKTDKQQTTIDQNKAAIVLKADQTTVNTLKGNVDQNTATLKTQADNIQSKVSASDVTGMLTGYATQSYTQSLVTQKAGTINESITNLTNRFNSLQVGGRNLLENSDKDISVTSHTTSEWPAWASIDVGYSFEPGKTYTFSAEAKNSTNQITEASIRVFEASTNTEAGLFAFPADGNRHSITFTVPNDTHNYHLLFFAGHAGIIPGVDVTTTYHHPKLEFGNVATDWTPNPDDMATVTQIQQVTASIDGLKSTVANKADKSQFTQLSNLIQGKVSSSDYTSKINQLSNDINLRVKSADLISQINLQAGAASIQSDKIVLDGNTTVITGEAFIPSAAISSISADKIMLGSSALYNSDGTLNLVNQSNNLKALIQVKQGLVQDTTQSIISFASDYNNRAFSITPVGATVTPTLFFERYDQTAGHWLGFSRNEVQREGLTFNTWDNEGERFFVSCHARFNKNITAEGKIMQGTWDGTTGSPLAGVLSIESGNTIWSGSGYLAIGDHISNAYTNVIAKSFSQQSTLSSKTNIETVDPKDALDLVNRTDIRSYQYKTDVAQGKTKRYTSLIIDDINDVSQYCAPDEFTNEERTGRDDGSAVGYLFLAVQELTRRIKTLEEKLNG